VIYLEAVDQVPPLLAICVLRSLLPWTLERRYARLFTVVKEARESYPHRSALALSGMHHDRGAVKVFTGERLLFGYI